MKRFDVEKKMKKEEEVKNNSEGRRERKRESGRVEWSKQKQKPKMAFIESNWHGADGLA